MKKNKGQRMTFTCPIFGQQVSGSMAVQQTGPENYVTIDSCPACQLVHRLYNNTGKQPKVTTLKQPRQTARPPN